MAQKKSDLPEKIELISREIIKFLIENPHTSRDKITNIKYFTAIVSGMFDSGQPIRQKTYIRALQKYIPEISVYYGHPLLNFLLNPARPNRPEPSKSIVVGSGTGANSNITSLMSAFVSA